MAGNRIDIVRDIGRAIPDPATNDPMPLGTGADKGTSEEFARSDHIHPCLHKTIYFNTPGAISWIIPEGITAFTVRIVGGGGSGYRRGDLGSAAEEFCGGGGGVAEKYFFNATPGESCSITVGAGGNGEATSSDGEDSVFSYGGYTVTGSGGLKGTASAGGQSGIGSGGDINHGLGPGSYERGGGAGGTAAQDDATGPGGGAHPTRYDGGLGGDGLIVIWW